MDRTQKEIVRKRLEKKKSITSYQAFVYYGITRLSAIIYDLRKEGYNIGSETITKKNRYGNVCNYAKYMLLG